MKIYTKTGDQGETGLLGGIRVNKSHLAIEVCGSLDEANSLIGVGVSFGLPEVIALQLTQIQNDLFDLGSRVAACLSDASRPAQFPVANIEKLESWIDQAQSSVPPLTAFILPGGSPGGAHLHLARSVCRRAERRLVSLVEAGVKQELSVELIYLNRLGDLLFVLARSANQLAGVTETKWSASE